MFRTHRNPRRGNRSGNRDNSAAGRRGRT
jgi:hypothetical protein